MISSARQADLIIRFQGAKLLLIFAPLAALVALSVVVNPESWRDAPLWVYGVFGGLALFLVFACLVMPRRHYLHLTSGGLAIQYLTSRRQYAWHEVRSFRVAQGPAVAYLPTGRRIVFDLADDSPHRTPLVRVAAHVNGYDGSILDTFGIGAEELARVLNEWQQCYG